jgi:hypothetical protein
MSIENTPVFSDFEVILIKIYFNVKSVILLNFAGRDVIMGQDVFLTIK